MPKDSPSSPLRSWIMTINHHPVVLHLVRQLSLPSRGTVFHVQGSRDGSEKEPQMANYVLKEIAIKDDDAGLEMLKTRWETLQKLNHDNVVRYYHFEVFQRSLQVHAVVLMEWCQMGSVAELFKDTSPDLCAMHKLTKDIVTGVAYIHSRGIFHGDIKPHNIFIGLDANEGLQAKIGDLDDFVSVPEGVTNQTCLKPADLVGTFVYLSPERRSDAIDGNRNATNGLEGIKRNADTWSMGCTFAYLAVHRELRFVKPNGEIFKMMKNPNRKHEDAKDNKTPQEKAVLLEKFIQTGGKPQIPNNIPKILSDFIDVCLIEDPLQRPTAEDLLADPWMFCDPEVRYVDGIYQRPFVIKLRSNNLLPRHTDSEKEHIDISWSNSANCGVRFLAHFQAPKFNIADAEVLIHKCPKALDPGKPLKKKYCNVLKELMPTIGIKNEFMLQMAYALLDNEQMLAGFTANLQPVGAPFPELVEWLNTFETDYECVVKENASWSDIEAELEAERPVLVMTQSGGYEIRPYAKQILQAEGIPDEVPALNVTIVHGFTGSTDESRFLICTGSDGVMGEWAYSDFIQCWDWKLDDWRIARIFECAQVRKRSMVYRREKKPDSASVGGAPLSGRTPAETMLDMTMD